MRDRKWVLGATLALIGLPAVLVPIEAIAFHAANRDTGSLVSSGEMRDYLLYVPTTYDRSRPTPLVISLHGGAMWGAAQRETSQWDREAERQGFIVVYPSGVGGRGPRAWRAGPEAGAMTEVRFIADLIDTLAVRYNVDRARVYANGLSNGGGMAFVLSCALPDRIAAVGVVATAVFLPWNACPDHRAVPMIAFHGTADRQTRYHGGRTWVAPWTFPDIPTWVATWARRNHCAPEPSDSLVAPDVTRRAYSSCADDAAVVLYTVEGGGHTWPGGGPLPEWFVGTTTRSIDATSLMWAFYRDHPLPR
jgi:polyhydroxybutyrate depolymerase